MIKPYTSSLLTGEVAMIEDGFIPVMDIFCNLLGTHNLKAYIISSFRKDTNVSGAIVQPALMSNHLIGHAIDVNIIDKTGKFWNSKLLANPEGDVLDFINDIRKSILRWGGDFSTPDVVHFDDRLNLLNADLWKDLYNAIHGITSFSAS